MSDQPINPLDMHHDALANEQSNAARFHATQLLYHCRKLTKEVGGKRGRRGWDRAATPR